MMLSDKQRIVLANLFNGLTFNDGDYSYIVISSNYKDINAICSEVDFNNVKYYVIEVISQERYQYLTRRKHIGLFVKEDYLQCILDNKCKVYIDGFVVRIHDVGNFCLGEV